MRKGLLIAAALAALTFNSAHAGWALPKMNAQIDATNFLLDVNSCSGTLVAPDLVLTAKHCLKKDQKEGTAEQIFYRGAKPIKTDTYRYDLVALDVDKDDKEIADLALLRLRTKLPNAVAPIACREPVRGETIYAVGNSFGTEYASVTKGIVSSITRSYKDIDLEGNDTDHALIQLSAPIAPGNSGGALYDEQGELIGVNVVITQGFNGFNFAVPVDDVNAFLKAQGVVRRECQ